MCSQCVIRIAEQPNEGSNTHLLIPLQVTSWAVDKSAELIWFGATVSIVFGLPVLLEVRVVDSFSASTASVFDDMS